MNTVIKKNFLLLFFQEIRIKQWIKNALVFGAAIFQGSILNLNILFDLIILFFAFSFTSSAIYIINDIMDIKKDQQHPKKNKRPIASGEISINISIIIMVILLSFGQYLAWKINDQICYILFFYICLNFLYSIKLKHIVIVDIIIIALGFILRAISGAIAIGSLPTNWFILCIFMISLFLALGKRRYEMNLFCEDKGKQREILHSYTINFLDQLIMITISITITCYAIFAEQDKSSYMIFTLLFVIYGIFRYLYIIEILQDGEKPEEILLKDKHILITVVLYILSVIFIRSF